MTETSPNGVVVSGLLNNNPVYPHQPTVFVLRWQWSDKWLFWSWVNESYFEPHWLISKADPGPRHPGMPQPSRSLKQKSSNGGLISLRGFLGRPAYIFLETILSYQALKWLRHLLPSFCLRLLPSTFCLRHMGPIFCLRQLATIFCLRHLLPLFCLSYNELSSSGKGPRSGPLRMTLKTWDFIAD